MGKTRLDVKNEILASFSGLFVHDIIAEIIAKSTNHTIHLVHLEDKNKMGNLDLSKLVRAIRAGNILKTCNLDEKSCRLFYYDETTGVARTAKAGAAVEFVDNAEAFCFYVAHHKKIMKYMGGSDELCMDAIEYFGEGTTYIPPKYEKIGFAHFEKVGRCYGLDDEGIDQAKKMATMNFDYYKTISNENDWVLSAIANMSAIREALALKIDERFRTVMDWKVDAHEDGDLLWYYEGVPISTKDTIA